MSYTLQPSDSINCYHIQKTLGTGGFGVTYKAIDSNLRREVAIKEYFPTIAYRAVGSCEVYAKSPSNQREYDIGLDRFYNEAQMLAQFSHINIVRILNVFSANNTAYMVMEYEHGQDLSQFMNNISRPLCYGEIIGFFIPILDGLRAMHKHHVLHLDLKPDNIFIRSNSVPCLIDFGGARHHAAQASRLVVAKVSFMVATDGYSPPEQYSDDKKSKGFWSDIYALGATLYACMDNGTPPPSSMARFDSIMNAERDPLQPATVRFSGKYPEDLLKLVDCCLSPQRERRPQNAQEMQDILIKIANKEPIKWKQPIYKTTPPASRGNPLEPPPLSPPPSQTGGASKPETIAVATPSVLVYAGFWLRIAAFILDTLLILVVLFLIGFAIGFAVNNAKVVGNSETFDLFDIFSIILQWLYFAGMESSTAGGTFGKRAVDIRVVDLQGQRISFGRATGRYFGKIISALILFIGFFMIGFTSKKQGLHDMIADTLVIKKM